MGCALFTGGQGSTIYINQSPKKSCKHRPLTCAGETQRGIGVYILLRVSVGKIDLDAFSRRDRGLLFVKFFYPQIGDSKPAYSIGKGSSN